MEMLEHVPRSGVDRRRVRGAGAARRRRSCSRRSTAIPSRTCSRSSAPSTCSACCRAARTTGREVPARPPSSRGFARRAGLELAGDHRHDLQPARRRRYRLEPDTSVNYMAAFRRAGAHGLTRRRSAQRSLPVDAVLFDLDGTLADTAPAISPAPLNRVRARSRPARRSGGRRCARTRRPARAGMLGAGMGVTPDDPGLSALRDAFLAHYARGTVRDTTRCSTASTRCSTRSSARARAGASSPTRRRASRRRWSKRSGSRTRAGAVVCGDTTPHPEAASRAAACTRPRSSASPPARCVYVGDAQRDVAGGQRGGHGDDRRALRLHRSERRRRPTWPATAGSTQPGDLLAWLPARAIAAG